MLINLSTRMYEGDVLGTRIRTHRKMYGENVPGRTQAYRGKRVNQEVVHRHTAVMVKNNIISSRNFTVTLTFQYFRRITAAFKVPRFLVVRACVRTSHADHHDRDGIRCWVGRQSRLKAGESLCAVCSQ